MKTCPSCKQIKPLDSFYRQRAAKDGHSSWCKDCAQKKSAESAKRIRKHRTVPAPHNYRDPSEYSRRVCLHIAQHVERSIRRFEKNTQREAPPHLTHILAIARQTADQLTPPPKIPQLPALYNRTCPSCGETFTTKNSLKVQCSKLCAKRMAGSRRRERLRSGISGPHRCTDCDKPIQRPGRCWGCHLNSGAVGRPRLTTSDASGTLPISQTT